MLTRTCIQCNKEFTMTESEIRFYKSKRLSLPKRCKECRDANKKLKAENDGQMPKAKETAGAAKTTQEQKGVRILPLVLGAVAVIAIIIVAVVLL